MSYIPMPPRNTTAEILAQSISKYIKVECSKHFPLTQIGDTAEITSGGTPDTNNSAFWDGDIVWITPKDLGRPRTIEITNSERKITIIGASSSSAKLLPIGTVLLSSRAPIGHLGISHVPLATNQGFKNIICKDRLNNRFLFHMLRGSIPDLQSYGRGNTFAEIPSKIVKEYAIPLPPIELQKTIASFLDTVYHRLSGNYIPLPLLPAPLAEQQRIVAKIERLAGKIEEARELRKRAVAENESLSSTQLHTIFDYLIRKHGSTKLERIITEASYGTSEKCSPIRNKGDIPILRIPNVASEKINLDDLKFANLSTHHYESLRLKNGDILVVRTNGSLDLVGRCAVVTELPEPTAFASYMIRLRLNKEIINPTYTQQMLRYLRISGQLTNFARTTAGQYNVSLGRLRVVEIPVPPIAEQLQILIELDNLQDQTNHLKTIQTQTTTELDAMLPSILDKAFKGEL